MTKARQCLNCGWGGPSSDFTFTWCNDCARAFTQGVASVVGGALVTYFLRFIL